MFRLGLDYGLEFSSHIRLRQDSELRVSHLACMTEWYGGRGVDEKNNKKRPRWRYLTWISRHLRVRSLKVHGQQPMKIHTVIKLRISWFKLTKCLH